MQKPFSQTEYFVCAQPKWDTTEQIKAICRSQDFYCEYKQIFGRYCLIVELADEAKMRERIAYVKKQIKHLVQQ
jgi:hypothetical protein